MILRMEKSLQRIIYKQMYGGCENAIEIVAYFCRNFLQYIKTKPMLLQ